MTSAFTTFHILSILSNLFAFKFSDLFTNLSHSHFVQLPTFTQFVYFYKIFRTFELENCMTIYEIMEIIDYLWLEIFFNFYRKSLSPCQKLKMAIFFLKTHVKRAIWTFPQTSILKDFYIL